MIDVNDLDFRHAEGDFRLHIPSLRIKEKSSAVLIGPSGSGKTTLLNLLAGIGIPGNGSITIDGVEISGLSDSARRAFRVRRIGLVFQEFELLDHLHVRDNILLPYRLSPGLKLTPGIRDKAESLAREVGLGEMLRRPAPQLSQGERQRVAVCRALVTEPSLLLCDEPTGNLDPKNTEQILDILFAFAQRCGATLVTVTHDHGILHRFDRVIDFKSFQSPSA